MLEVGFTYRYMIWALWVVVGFTCIMYIAKMGNLIKKYKNKKHFDD